MYVQTCVKSSQISIVERSYNVISRAGDALDNGRYRELLLKNSPSLALLLSRALATAGQAVIETSSQPEEQVLQKLLYEQTPQGYGPPPPGWAQRLQELQDLVANMSYLSASSPVSVAPSPPARRDSRVAAPETKPGNLTSWSAARSASSVTSHATQNVFAAVLPQDYGPGPPAYRTYGYDTGMG